MPATYEGGGDIAAVGRFIIASFYRRVWYYSAAYGRIIVPTSYKGGRCYSARRALIISCSYRWMVAIKRP